MQPETLREGYELYLTGKHFGRRDMLGMIVDAVEALQAKSVDDAIVHELAARIGAMEMTIGNALRASADVSFGPRGPNAFPSDARPELGDGHSDNPVTSASMHKMLAEKGKPGRPRKQEAA